MCTMEDHAVCPKALSRLILSSDVDSALMPTAVCEKNKRKQQVCAAVTTQAVQLAQMHAV